MNTIKTQIYKTWMEAGNNSDITNNYKLNI